MNKHFKKLNIHGYSLVEVLVAVSILMIAIVGPLTIAAKSIQSSQYARQQITAYFLAQEGISLVQAIRNDQALAHVENSAENPWEWVNNSAAPYTSLDTCFNAAGCNIDARDNTLLDNIRDCSPITDCVVGFVAGSPELLYRRPLYKNINALNDSIALTATPYTRVITLSGIGDEVTVIAKVQWSSNLLGGTQEVKLETSLFNVYK